MAQRLSTQTNTLTRLAAELNRLDAKRDVLLNRIQATIASLVGNGTSPAVRSARGAQQRRRRGGRPKGFKVSAATRAKLRAAWKKRRQAGTEGS
jgi:hypothetical protein